MNTFVPSAEDVDRQLESEFREEVQDKAGQMDVWLGNLKAGHSAADKVLADIKVAVHTLRYQGQSLNLPLINLVIHRFDDFLDGVQELTSERANDLQTFVDKLNGVLDGDTDVESLEGSATLVRELPSKAELEATFGDLSQKIVEVLLISPERALSRILEKEMAACGYRTTTVRNPFQAFEMAVRIHPDLIIASMELGPLTGVDLACAFSAMPRTRDLPFALLTSYELSHSALDNLPPRAAVLRKGSQFGESLAEALTRFRIT